MKTYRINDRTQYLVLGVYMLGVIVFHGFYISRLTGPFIYADEIGYWSHAAHMTGNTWAGVMDGVSWYSFGYSFLLALTFLFSSHMLIMYRAAIVFNMIMSVGIFLLAHCIIRRFVPEHKTVVTGLFAFMLTTYPTYIFYSHTTLCETMFTLIVWLLFYEVVLLEEKPTLWRAGALGCTAVYGFAVHNRMLAVLGAAAVCLLLLWGTHRMNWKHILAAAVSAGIFFAGYLLMKEYLSLAIVQNQVVESAGGAVAQGSYNTFGFVFQKFLRMFQWKNIKNVFLNVVGQIWECLSSSYLLAGIGVVYGVKKLIDGRDSAKGKCLYLFPLVSMLFSIGMTGIVAYGGLTHVGDQVRLDNAFIGRYSAPLIPMLVMLACVMLLEEETASAWKYFVGVLAVYLAAAAGVYFRLYGIENGYLNIVSSVAIHIFHWLGGFSVVKCVAVALAVSVVFLGMCRFTRKHPWNYCLAFLMLAFLFSMTAFYCMRTSIRGENDNTARYTPMFAYLEENTEKREVVYICQDGKMSYDLQTRLPDRAVVCTLPEQLESVPADTYVVICQEQLASLEAAVYEACLENEEYVVIKVR